MKKSRKRSSSDWSGIAMRTGEVLLGIAAGSVIAKTIGNRDNVSGVDLLGLDGDTSGYVTPLITAAVGAAAIQFGKSDILRNIGMGCAIAGGVKLVNKVAGKSLISLNGTDDDEKVFLPGIGDAETMDDAMTANEWETTYNEPALLTTPNPEVNGVSEPLTAEPVGGILR